MVRLNARKRTDSPWRCIIRQPASSKTHNLSAERIPLEEDKSPLWGRRSTLAVFTLRTNIFHSAMKAIACFLVALAISSAAAQQLKQTQADPCQAKGKMVADATYCDRYWECIDGVAEQFDCPNGLVFAGRARGLLENCDYPWRGDSCEGKQLANTPVSVGPCDWKYGIFGHESSCIRYWTCWNSTATEQFCIGGLLYNEEKHACDWPEAVEGCQKHPLCKDDANGNVPLGKSCNRYWACQGGYPRLQRCPATLVFDKRSLRCTNPPTEDCEAPPPPPPEDDPNAPAGPAFVEEEEPAAPAPLV